MKKNPSHEKPKPAPRDEARTERDQNPQQETRRRHAKMADLQKGQKFTSDEDIIHRRTA